MVLTNLITNPSFETNVGGWTLNNATGAVADSSAVSGAKCLEITKTNNSTVTLFGDYIPVTAGRTFTSSAHIRNAPGVTSTVEMDVGFYFYRSNMGYLAQGLSPSASSSAVWQRLSHTMVAPAEAAFMRSYIRLRWSSTGFKYLIDAVSITETPSEEPYFDGDTPGVVWNGTPHASTSTGTPEDEPEPEPITPPTDEATRWYDFVGGMPEVFTGQGFAGTGDGPTGEITTTDNRTGLAPNTYMQVGNGEHSVSRYAAMDVIIGAGGGTVEFWTRRESEQNYDWTRFAIDGFNQYRVSGIHPWTKVSYPLSEGAHQLLWGYQGDISHTQGIASQRVTALTITNTTEQVAFSGWGMPL